VSGTVLTLIGKPGCHLCEDARSVVDRVLADFPDVALEERSILEDDELSRAYADEIPVVMIDGRVHTIWHVDADRLRDALTATAN
jgi:glutaredoxin